MITPSAVLSWPHLFVAQAQDDGKKPIFSATLIFLPESQETPEFKALETAAIEALMEKFNLTKVAAVKAVKAEKLHWPIHKGEKKDYPEGSVYFNVKTYQQPGIVSIYPDPTTGRPMPITSPEDAKYGSIVQASVNTFAYEHKGKKGVSFWLNNLQVQGYSEVLGKGGPTASEEFEADPSAVADLADMEEAQEDAPVEEQGGLDSLLS